MFNKIIQIVASWACFTFMRVNESLKILILLSSMLVTSLGQHAIAQTVIKMEKESGVYIIPCEVNGLKLRFIFDTGASKVCISLTEALFMLKNGYLKSSDIQGSVYSQTATGDITEGSKIVLRRVEFGGMELSNVEAIIIKELAAPLLLGQSAISRLGTYQIDPIRDELTIYIGQSDISNSPTYEIEQSNNFPSKKSSKLISDKVDSHREGVRDKEDIQSTKGSGYRGQIDEGELDSDGDGIVNDDDLCPSVKGPTFLQGCPANTLSLVSKVSFKVYFNEGATQLSYPSENQLDELSEILKRYPELKLLLKGYIRSGVGLQEKILISRRCCELVKQYVASKGIDPERIKYRAAEDDSLRDEDKATDINILQDHVVLIVVL